MLLRLKINRYPDKNDRHKENKNLFGIKKHVDKIKVCVVTVYNIFFTSLLNSETYSNSERSLFD